MDRFHIISSMVLLSFCFLSAASAQNSLTDLTRIGSKITTLYTTISPNRSSTELITGNQSALTLNLKYSVGDPGPVCFLEILENTNTTYWTKPCPRTPQLFPPLGFWCQFEFSLDGNLRLASGTNFQNQLENLTVLWTSGTSGMGGRTLELVEGTSSGSGNLILYNANREIVWRNIDARTALNDYSCTSNNQTQTIPAPAPAPSAGCSIRAALHGWTPLFSWGFQLSTTVILTSLLC